MQLPLGVFAVALGTAILPALSRQAAEGNTEGLRETYGFGLRVTWFILVPATVLLIVLARPILTLLFARGAFGRLSSLEMTTAALVFFSLGLCAYGSVKSLVALYYAHQDTRYPVRCAAAAMIVNIVLNLLLMQPLRLGGLALATALASFLNVALLLRGIPRRLNLRPAEGLQRAAVRLLVAGAGCGLAAWALERFLPGPPAIRVAAALAGGAAVDLWLVHLLGGDEPRALGGILTRRFRRA
jgi:putative peptidoglycan lipid II flippase